MPNQTVSVNVVIPDTIQVSVSAILPLVNAPVNVCVPVSIVNQLMVEIASVPSGSNYAVVQLSELVDDEDLNTTTVLDTL
jgi:hypothetical protein